jgi:mono/diheme cytochrome c family protein
MRIRCQGLLAVVVGLAMGVAAGPKVYCEDSKPAVDYERDVLPLFRSHCFDCHGPDAQESGLRLDHRTSLTKGGDSGEPAIVPGHADQSLLIRLVAQQDKDYVMPPDGEPLTEKQVDVLRRWINQGATMPDDAGTQADERLSHWAFQPLEPVAPPLSGDPFIVTPIDSFVLAGLQQQGLQPGSPADPQQLVRRMYLIMHGLPPTVEQLQMWTKRFAAAAVQDQLGDNVRDYSAKHSQQVLSALVDDLLASPRYGERWASHWLDIVRFGETHGFETNRERPNAWPYRDYVIDAFNSDKPYDQFVREQIAGDAYSANVATGFLVAGPHDLVKSPDIVLTLTQRQDELADLINTTGTAFLGLTLGCARCHNHKFDPVTQKDYYAIQAVFAGVEHGDRALPVTGEQRLQLQHLDEQIAQLQEQLQEFVPQATPAPADLRAAVNARHNVDPVKSVKARFVKFTVQQTNSSEPCLDELEVWSGDTNVALAATGATVTSSGNLKGYDIHKLEHVNDGQHGNSRSWISDTNGKGWVQIAFPKVVEVDRIEWSRDRQGRFADRLATSYVIECSTDAENWQTVASSADRRPFGQAVPTDPVYDFESAAPDRAAQGRAWLNELKKARQDREQAAKPQLVYAGTFRQPEPVHRLYRGDPMAKREVVLPGTISSLGSLDAGADLSEQARRVKFAEWIASDQNPLTARVAVNRIWQHHFGTGLVETPSDLGANGAAPSHPQLLDWLAGYLISHNWSIKSLHRQILLSATWQQSSLPQAEAIRTDAQSRLLWRHPPRRLEAEAIRDSILSVSGVLDKTSGGPGFSGFEVEMENVRHFFPKQSYGPEDFRRMVYMTKVRQERDSVFGAFDCPDASQTMPRRSRSTTPLQALNLLNSEFIRDQSQRFAERLSAESSGMEDQIHSAYLLCFSRRASAEEVSDAGEFISAYGLPAFCRAMLNANEFLFIP